MDGPLQSGVFLFERCRVDPIGRTLTRDGVRIAMPSRLFDTLLYLVQNAGRLVERHELLGAVWPGRTVDESSVGRAISSLRVVLKENGIDETVIVTASGRGYRFGARVTFEPVQPPPSHSLAPAPAPAPAAPLHDARAPNPRRWRMGVGVVVAAALAGMALYLSRGQTRPDAPAFAPPARSVAVLPFANEGGDPAQAYLADGLADELINALGRVASLRVAARQSSFSFRAKPLSVRDIARQLDVGRVLEGSVQRIGGAVRVTTELVDGASGYVIWSRRFDRNETGMLAVEGQIAEAVVTSLVGALSDKDLASLALGGTVNAAAFDAYLAGMMAIDPADQAGNERAITAFNQAIALDPAYAEALVQRARAQIYLAVNGSVAVARKGTLLDGAQHDAEQAVALAPGLGAAHAALALALEYRQQDLADAAAEFRRASTLAPDDAAIAISQALFEADVGNLGQALAQIRHAIALDPLQPIYDRILAEFLGIAQHYDEALEALRRARSQSPPDPNADRIVLGLVQLYQRDMAGARQTCAGARDQNDLVCLAIADHALGRTAEAEAVFTNLRAQLGSAGAYLYAEVCASWGQKDQAIDWLRQAYDLRDPGLMGVRSDPMLAPLHGMRGYEEVVRQMRFPAPLAAAQ